MASSHPPSWSASPKIKGKTELTQMMLLNCAGIGLSFCWGTEMTYCAPYLLSLGMSKSRLSLVWVAGPLSGLVMQPIIGTISDRSCSKYGRRRPFMLLGTMAVVICLVVLGWTREIVGLLVNGDENVRQWAIALAVVDIFVLDFAINISQTTCAALVVDTLPVSKQQLGSAWGSRMGGVGQMLVYAIGALDLDGLLGNFLGNTQLKKVCVIAASAMVLAQGTTCWAVAERVPIAPSDGRDERIGLMSILSQIYHTTRNIPVRIQAICRVQFWSWIGWFPFLFYGSTWVGEIYLRHEAHPNGENRDALSDVSRHGSQSFVILSLVSFGASIVLPWLVRSPDDDDGIGYTARPPQRFGSILCALQRNKPSLLTAWAMSNMLFASSMIFAPFVSSVRSATFLIALCAIPKAISSWAPGTFLGVEVNRMSSSSTHATQFGDGPTRKLSHEVMEMEEGGSASKILHVRHSSTASIGVSSTGELSGIYLGILNIYTTIPQFIGTGISWIVFSILEPGKSPELAPDEVGDKVQTTKSVSGIAVCLFIGALCAMMAAWSTRKLQMD